MKLRHGQGTPERNFFSNEEETEITDYLHQWCQGERGALDALLPEIYGQLRRVAGFHTTVEKNHDALQVTELVNETFIQLRNGKRWTFENRRQFYLFVGRLMRFILVNDARRRLARKRGSGNPVASLDDEMCSTLEPLTDPAVLLTLDDALCQLKELDPRQARVIQLRFYAGMNNTEIAEALGISITTVKREWRTGKCWLARALGTGNCLDKVGGTG